MVAVLLLIRRSLADQPAHEGDELIDLCRCSVETGHQANDAAAAPREADSGRRQGLDGRLWHRGEREIGLDRCHQTYAGYRRQFATEARCELVRVRCETQKQAVLDVRNQL